MRVVFSALALVCVLIASPGRATRQAGTSDSTSCAVVQQALNDFQHLKVGVTRREVEKYFKRDGGMQFPLNTRYVYPKCDHLRVDIDFEAPGSTAEKPFSPDDTAAKVSNLFVAYPARD